MTQRFWSLFFCQFWGAFNDNLFKNALVIYATFHLSHQKDAGWFTSLAAGLFILPFILFSPLAGQLTDRYPKYLMIRFSKIAEVIFMILGAWGFLQGEMGSGMLALLFLMGTHSAFFGPAKYSVLRELLPASLMSKGTSWIEMGTFLAILLGTILGGLLIGWGPRAVAWAVMGCALWGCVSGWRMGKTHQADADLQVTWNIFKQYRQLWIIFQENRSITWGILGISWFWFCGSVFFSQIPTFVKFALHGDENTVTWLLSSFTFSLAVGAWLTDKLSGKTLELGLVPLGTFGMGICLLWLSSIPQAMNGELIFQAIPAMMGVGVLGSLFIVPLYTLLQDRSRPEATSQVVAANNVFNSLLMVLASLVSMGIYSLGFGVVELFKFLGILHVFFGIVFALNMPEFPMRMLFWIWQTCLVKVISDREGEFFSQKSPTILRCQREGLGVWAWTFLAHGACHKAMNFVIPRKDYEHPFWKFVYAALGFIPWDQENESFFSHLEAQLKDGHILVLIGLKTHQWKPQGIEEDVLEWTLDFSHKPNKGWRRLISAHFHPA